MGQLLEGIQVIGLNELRELLRPQLHEGREDLVLIPNPCALEAFHKHLLVCQMVGVSHHANAHALAGFVLELGRDLVPHRRNLIAHQNVIGFERLSPLEQRFQLGIQFCPLLLQSFQSGNLLLERRAHASLLAGRLVERG